MGLLDVGLERQQLVAVERQIGLASGFVVQNHRSFVVELVAAGSWSEIDYLVARCLLNVMKYILPHYYFVFLRYVSLAWREFR